MFLFVVRFVRRALFAFILLYYCLLPIIIRIHPEILRDGIFQQGVYSPLSGCNVSEPSTCGFDAVRNYYMSHDPLHSPLNNFIGVWHFSKHHKFDIDLSDDEYIKQQLYHSDDDILIYFHGNTAARFLTHRRQLAERLNDHYQLHVFSIDYRGYADSSSISPITEESVVVDGLLIYRKLRQLIKNNRKIFIWGHSLGSGVATHLTKILSQSKNDSSPDGLILEAPMSSIHDAIMSFPIGKPLTRIPLYARWLSDAIDMTGIKFDSYENICSVDSPVMILHAEDDKTLPFWQGVKLYEQGKRCEKNITFVPIERKYRCRHKYIMNYPKLDENLKKFFHERK
ncbi:hypothetical protein SNEBB_008261 [Seison nebaliae]|nr:hypothetical protein SNEBB_008261 [Seison nebaliae]